MTRNNVEIVQSIEELKKSAQTNHLETIAKIEGTSNEVGELRKELASLQHKFGSVVMETVALKKELLSVKAELNDLRQDNLSSNIIIKGLCEVDQTHVELKSLVSQVFKKIEPQCEDDHILDIYRMGKRIDGKIRPVLVKLTSRLVRNHLLQVKKKTIVHVNSILQNNEPITQGQEVVYMEEHLTRENADIFAQARRLKSEGAQFVWLKNGRILVRLSEGEAPIRIQRIEDVRKLEKVLQSKKPRKRPASSPPAAPSITTESTIDVEMLSSGADQVKKPSNPQKIHKKEGAA